MDKGLVLRIEWFALGKDARMEKNELIKSILQFNVSTTADFLGRFSESDLKAYLDRVSLVCTPAMAKRSARSPVLPPRSSYAGKIRRFLRVAHTYWMQGLTARRVPS